MGSIVVFVADSLSGSPVVLGHASISEAGPTAVTDSVGCARLNDLPAGWHALRVGAFAHRFKDLPVLVAEKKTDTLWIRLAFQVPTTGDRYTFPAARIPLPRRETAFKLKAIPVKMVFTDYVMIPRLSKGVDVALHPGSKDNAALVVEIVDSTVTPAKPIECCASVRMKQAYFVANNKRGMLRIKGLIAGKETVEVASRGWPVQPLDTVTLVRGKVSHLRHVMKAGDSGCVFVLASDSSENVHPQPMPGASVIVLGLRKGCLTDSWGRGLICGLPVGTYEVTVRKWGLSYRPHTSVARVQRGCTDTLRVGLRWDSEGARFEARMDSLSAAAIRTARSRRP